MIYIITFNNKRLLSAEYAYVTSEREPNNRVRFKRLANPRKLK